MTMTYIKQRKAEREVVFLSFADTRFARSLERLRGETEEFPFTTRLFLTEKDLPADFRRGLHPRRYPRGYGYWKWKPYLIDKVMGELKDGDILVYSDGGTHFEKRGLKRFGEYLQMTNDSESGFVVFQQPFLEKDWAKGDLLDYCGMYNDSEVLTSLQLWGGVIIINVNKKSRAITKEWTEICLDHFHLISDKRSRLPNASGVEPDAEEISPCGDTVDGSRFPLRERQGERQRLSDTG